MKGILKDKKAFLIFLLPALVFYLFSVFYPIAESIRFSFIKWGGLGEKKFVGLQNYIHLFQDKVFYTAFWNNLVYLVIVVGMQILIGLLLAVLLTYLTKGVAFIKTLYYVPCIITAVAVTQLFRSMYATQPEGIINQILKAVGLGQFATSWLTNIKTVLVCVSIPEGWRYTGMYMVIFYAALISLDPEICEAARIDGANGWQTLIRVKLPMIKEVLLLTLTMVLTGALRGFDIPFILTNGGPGNVSELMSTYMYKKAFAGNQFGYGSTIAVFIIAESILVVCVLKVLFTGKDEREERRIQKEQRKMRKLERRSGR